MLHTGADREGDLPAGDAGVRHLHPRQQVHLCERVSSGCRCPVGPPVGVCRDAVELSEGVLYFLPDPEDAGAGGDSCCVLHQAARPVHSLHVGGGSRVLTVDAFGASGQVGWPAGDHLALYDRRAVRHGLDDTAGPDLSLADIDQTEPGGGVQLRHVVEPPDPRPLASQALVSAPEVDFPAVARPGGGHRQQVLKNKTKVNILLRLFYYFFFFF